MATRSERRSEECKRKRKTIPKQEIENEYPLQEDDNATKAKVATRGEGKMSGI